MGDYRKLTVWKKAHSLTLSVYAATRGFPAEERYGLVSQMRRSAASVPTNIAEGCGRRADRENLQFLRIAHGSATELDYQLLLARDLGYARHEQWQILANESAEVRAMLRSLMTRIRQQKPGGGS